MYGNRFYSAGWHIIVPAPAHMRPAKWLSVLYSHVPGFHYVMRFLTLRPPNRQPQIEPVAQAPAKARLNLETEAGARARPIEAGAGADVKLKRGQNEI